MRRDPEKASEGDQLRDACLSMADMRLSAATLSRVTRMGRCRAFHGLKTGAGGHCELHMSVGSEFRLGILGQT